MSAKVPYVKDRAGESPLATRPMDLSAVVIKTRNMYGPEIALRWNSYTGETTSLGGQLIMAVSTALGRGQRPAWLELHTLDTVALATDTEPLKDTPAIPVLEKTVSSIPVRWVKESNHARINLHRLFLAKPFPIPRGQVAHIPLSTKPLKDGGAALILHFSQVRYSNVDPDGPRRKAARAQDQEPSSPS